MPNENNDEVIVDEVEDSNEKVEETPEETPKEEKPKRTPQEELEYFEGRANRIRKKLGIEKPTEIESKKAPTGKPSESDLNYGEKAFLKTYGIQGSDELALVKNFVSRTGDDLDTIVSDDIFLGKLNNLRQARESANAIPKGKNRSGQTGITDIDLAVAKYKETGELPTDFATRNKVVDAITTEEKGDMFSGPSVIK